MTTTRTFNDNSHSFKRRKRRITNDGHNGLVSIGSSCGSSYCSCLDLLLLLCFVLGVLPQHYFPMDVSTEIFPTRAFQMGVSGVHAGVWGVLTEKFHSSKLMGLYGAARDVPPLFLI